MKIKYLLYPGEITLKSDKQVHYVSAEDLIRLYKINPKECMIGGIENLRGRNEKDYIHLHPCSSIHDYEIVKDHWKKNGK